MNGHPRERPCGPQPSRLPAQRCRCRRCSSEHVGDPRRLLEAGDASPAQEVDPPRPTAGLPRHAADERRPIPADTPIEDGAELRDLQLGRVLVQGGPPRFVEEYSDHDITFKAVTTFNNMDEAVAKMQAGQIEADVFFPTIDVVHWLEVAGLLQPLNHDLVPNLEANFWPVYPNPPTTTRGGATACRTSSTTPASRIAVTRRPTTRSARWTSGVRPALGPRVPGPGERLQQLPRHDPDVLLRNGDRRHQHRDQAADHRRQGPSSR